MDVELSSSVKQCLRLHAGEWAALYDLHKVLERECFMQ